MFGVAVVIAFDRVLFAVVAVTLDVVVVLGLVAFEVVLDLGVPRGPARRAEGRPMGGWRIGRP